MIFLRSISLKREFDNRDFPFNIKCIRKMGLMEFNSNVTFFVGENGAGKSTLLEALAAGLDAVAIGSADINLDNTLIPVREFANNLRFIKNKRPKNCVFFRAEDAFGFTKRLIHIADELREIEQQFENEIIGNGKERAKGSIRGQLHALEGHYGANPDAKSHGEFFLNTLNQRLRPNSLYFLDEPETPLSPLRQLALMSMIKKYVETGCQFIIATHSPILMAYAGADILYFGEEGIEKLNYDDVEHVSITKSFLNNPQRYLNKL